MRKGIRVLVKDLIRPLPDAPTDPALRNATLLPGLPHEEFPALLAAADILLVPLATTCRRLMTGTGGASIAPATAGAGP